MARPHPQTAKVFERQAKAYTELVFGQTASNRQPDKRHEQREESRHHADAPKRKRSNRLAHDDRRPVLRIESCWRQLRINHSERPIPSAPRWLTQAGHATPPS